MKHNFCRNKEVGDTFVNSPTSEYKNTISRNNVKDNDEEIPDDNKEDKQVLKIKSKKRKKKKKCNIS